MTIRPKAKKILKRQWPEIRDSWLRDLPEIPSAACKPTSSLSDLLALTNAHQNIDQNNEVIHGVSGLRQIALWEAVFLLHKSGSVMRACQTSVKSGMKTWSMFDGYHSAYFGARAVMALLGVAVPRPAGQQLLVELFPNIVMTNQKDRKRLSIDSSCCLAYKLNQLKQQDMWGLFIRILRVSEAAVWDDRIVDNLIGIGEKAFSKKRNKILYDPIYWEYEDLVECETAGDFCVGYRAFPDGFEQLDGDDPRMSVLVSFMIFNLGYKLLDDLADQAPVLKEQTAIYADDWWRGENPNYCSFYPS